MGKIPGVVKNDPVFENVNLEHGVGIILAVGVHVNDHLPQSDAWDFSVFDPFGFVPNLDIPAGELPYPNPTKW